MRVVFMRLPTRVAIGKLGSPLRGANLDDSTAQPGLLDVVLE